VTNPQGDAPDWLQPAQYVSTLLASGLISGVAFPVNVARFASVRVMLGNNDGTSLASAIYQFGDTASGQIIDAGLLSANATTQNPNWPVWNLPVQGDTLTLFAVSGAPTCWIVGTNRVLRKGMAMDAYPIRIFAGTIAANAPANTTVELLGADDTSHDSIAQANCSNYNGQVMLSWSGSNTSPTGNGFVRYIDASGTEQTQILFQNFSTTIARFMTGHPAGYVRWRFITNAVQANNSSVLTLVVIPAETFPN